MSKRSSTTKKSTMSELAQVAASQGKERTKQAATTKDSEALRHNCIRFELYQDSACTKLVFDGQIEWMPDVHPQSSIRMHLEGVDQRLLKNTMAMVYPNEETSVPGDLAAMMPDDHRPTKYRLTKDILPPPPPKERAVLDRSRSKTKGASAVPNLLHVKAPPPPSGTENASSQVNESLEESGTVGKNAAKAAAAKADYLDLMSKAQAADPAIAPPPELADDDFDAIGHVEPIQEENQLGADKFAAMIARIEKIAKAEEYAKAHGQAAVFDRYANVDTFNLPENKDEMNDADDGKSEGEDILSSYKDHCTNLSNVEKVDGHFGPFDEDYDKGEEENSDHDDDNQSKDEKPEGDNAPNNVNDNGSNNADETIVSEDDGYSDKEEEKKPKAKESIPKVTTVNNDSDSDQDPPSKKNAEAENECWSGGSGFSFNATEEPEMEEQEPHNNEKLNDKHTDSESEDECCHGGSAFASKGSCVGHNSGEGLWDSDDDGELLDGATAGIDLLTGKCKNGKRNRGRKQVNKSNRGRKRRQIQTFSERAGHSQKAQTHKKKKASPNYSSDEFTPSSGSDSDANHSEHGTCDAPRNNRRKKPAPTSKSAAKVASKAAKEASKKSATPSFEVVHVTTATEDKTYKPWKRDIDRGNESLRYTGDRPENNRQQVDALSRKKLNAMQKCTEMAQLMMMPLSRSDELLDESAQSDEYKEARYLESDMLWVMPMAAVYTEQGANGDGQTFCELNQGELHCFVHSEKAQHKLEEALTSGKLKVVTHNDFSTFRARFASGVKREKK